MDMRPVPRRLPPAAVHRSPYSPAHHPSSVRGVIRLLARSRVGRNSPLRQFNPPSTCLRVASGVSSCNLPSSAHCHRPSSSTSSCASTIQIATTMCRRDLVCTRTKAPAWSSMHVAKTDVVTKNGWCCCWPSAKGTVADLPFQEVGECWLGGMPRPNPNPNLPSWCRRWTRCTLEWIIS